MKASLFIAGLYLGLKFGLYEDYGNLTCGGYPGVLQNMELDAKTFAGKGSTLFS